MKTSKMVQRLKTLITKPDDKVWSPEIFHWHPHAHNGRYKHAHIYSIKDTCKYRYTCTKTHTLTIFTLSTSVVKRPTMHSRFSNISTQSVSITECQYVCYNKCKSEYFSLSSAILVTCTSSYQHGDTANLVDNPLSKEVKPLYAPLEIFSHHNHNKWCLFSYIIYPKTQKNNILMFLICFS